MKKFSTILILSFILITASRNNELRAQSVSDVFLTQTPVTWLGVDYSDMRFIGPLDISASQLDDYAKVINDLILREPKKYNLVSAFDKQTITPNLKYIEPLNAAMNTDKAVSSDSKDMQRYTKESIAKTVQAYHLKETGIGLVFIVEALSKTDEAAAIWVTFVDMSSSKVLLTERVVGKPAGFGFRNYWAGAIYSCLKQIKGGLYKDWKKKSAK